MIRPTAGEPRREPRSHTILVAFLLGLPLATLILGVILYGPVPEEVRRYVKHPVECVEVVMFCVALGALSSKWWSSRAERRACRAEVLPAWDGRPISVTEAPALTERLRSLPARLQCTWIGRRVGAVLDFLRLRGSTAELDDHLRALADEDALALESSYAFTRFLTWAMPILGFLGTVLGITESIAGVTPEKLDQDLSQVTDGLALAFDATALALALTMATMFLNFLVERIEQGVLTQVDRYVERELAHRFQRGGAESTEFVAVLRQSTDVLLCTLEQMVERQAAVWMQSLAQVQLRHVDAERLQQEKLTAALETALTRTLESHSRHLYALEQQSIGRGADLEDRLAQVAQSVTAQADALQRLQEQEGQLLRIQESLDRNLTTLAGSGAFEQAVESLTAAIHLFTARTGGQAANPPRSRPGAAA